MIKRIITYTIAMIILAFGSAFAVQSNLGVSPMGAIPYVLSLAINHDFFTIGMISTMKFLILPFGQFQASASPLAILVS